MDHAVARPGEGPEDGHARDLVRALLLEALASQRDGRLPEATVAGVRRETQAMCACAREAQLPIERVLVALKQEWHEMPEVRALRRPDAVAVLERVVTMCIDEYYRDRQRH